MDGVYRFLTLEIMHDKGKRRTFFTKKDIIQKM